MTDALARPLTSLNVGLSVSESDDSVSRGFPVWQVNHVTLQVAAALMGQGAGVVFGHDWREDGVMEAVHAFALRMQAPDAALAGPPATAPLLQNLLPWPDEPRLPADERRRLASTLAIEAAGLPDDLAPRALGPLEEPERAYFRARGLTYLRRRLTARTQARICLGGRTGGSQGRYPGLIEEAYLSVDARQPLFLAGLLGGATRQVIDALEGRPRPADFAGAPGLEGLYAAFAAGHRLEADAEIDPNKVWSRFGALGVRGLARQNKLTEEENRELFHTPAVERAIQLILLGLARFKPRGRTAAARTGRGRPSRRRP
ncbi:hypothetical protein [Methylorubrum extorquens]|uniref:Uncharacterized protein n=1 Tax=Methylorubrum extorquens (strain CM4 / NCIMB 13688) TaxID=440085 RepID=B7L2X9_METC4|nr:hypothetical protein [Methylorubrum extorquens]ACK86187.1 conserved hypothetical protein [Methylorubrum extorquens CM4]